MIFFKLIAGILIVAYWISFVGIYELIEPENRTDAIVLSMILLAICIGVDEIKDHIDIRIRKRIWQNDE